MTKPMFARVCAILQTLPSQTKWDDSIAVVYMSEMRDWSDDVVGAIMDHVIKTAEYRPTIAELRKIGIKLFDPKISVEQIYSDVRKILQNVPPEERQSFVDRQIEIGRLKPEFRNVVQAAGGWRWLREQTSETVQKEVRRAVSEVYERMNFDHVFVRPDECPALERGRKALEAIKQ